MTPTNVKRIKGIFQKPPPHPGRPKYTPPSTPPKHERNRTNSGFNLSKVNLPKINLRKMNLANINIGNLSVAEMDALLLEFA